MPFDGLAVAVICQELHAKLFNARVNKIYQVDKYTIVFNLRLPGKNKKLIISADPTHPRIHTTKVDFSNPLRPPAFCMLLRKYLEPSRIVSITQQDLERIIRIQFEALDETGDLSIKTLVFELMGRHSNIILLDKDENILDGIHRLTTLDGTRQVIPGASYVAPPDQGKVDPTMVTYQEFFDHLRLLPASEKIAQNLLDTYQGISPLAAKEILHRAQLNPSIQRKDTTNEDWDNLWHSLQQLLKEIEEGGIPSLIRYPQKEDFAAYQVTNEEITRYPAFDNLLDYFYTDRITHAKIQQYQSSLSKSLKTHLERLQKKEGLQKQALFEAENAAEWRIIGEILTANLYQVKKGEQEILLPNFYDPDQKEIKIQLDPRLSPSQNAQRYFKRYTKAKNSKKIIEEQLEKTKAERSYLEETLTHIMLADTIETLNEIEEELVETGFLNRSKKTQARKGSKTGTKTYECYISSDEIPIFIGRSNKQNDELTFRIGRPDDLWLHAQKIPGSHVIIRCDGEVPQTTILEAATLAARFSKAANLTKVPVDYAKRKHVRKPSGAKPGFVIYDHFETIIVNPNDKTFLPNKKE
ncbi:MAG: fibronectin/fibrinogen-binding protein [Firmicutes bacterium]|nr:fibronectin/fibrinogen-binding protein [Bacillota bacterium]